MTPIRSADTVVLKDKECVSVQEAARLSGYTPDYIQQLARSGKLEFELVGKKRFIELSSLGNFLKQQWGTGSKRAGRPRSATPHHSLQSGTLTERKLTVHSILDEEPVQSGSAPQIKKENKLGKLEEPMLRVVGALLALSLLGGVSLYTAHPQVAGASWNQKVSTDAFAQLVAPLQTHTLNIQPTLLTKLKYSEPPTFAYFDIRLDDSNLFNTESIDINTRLATASVLDGFNSLVFDTTCNLLTFLDFCDEDTVLVEITDTEEIIKTETKIERTVFVQQVAPYTPITLATITKAVSDLRTELLPEIEVAKNSPISYIKLPSNTGSGGATTFADLTDTPSALTANRIPFADSGGGSLTDSENLTFNGSTLSITGSLVATASTTFNGVEYLFPGSDGTTNQYLQTNAAGALAWASVAATANTFTAIDGAIYNATTTDQVLIGASSTTTTQKLEVIGGGYFSTNLGVGTTSPWSTLGVTATLDDATGNEAAVVIDYTTNKLTSGNDTGLVINQTDTASPGTSLLVDFQLGGTSIGYMRNDGLAFYNAAASRAWFYSGATPTAAIGDAAIGPQSGGVFAMGNGSNASGGLFAEIPSATNPTVVPDAQSDPNTGIGWAGVDQLSLIAGGLEGIRITESGSVASTTILGDFTVTDSFGGTVDFFVDDSTGNVGIGTTSPFTKLAITGTTGDIFRIAGTGQTNLFNVAQENSDLVISGGYLQDFIFRSLGNSASEGFFFQDSSQNNLIFIDTVGTDAGNLGIGTTSPYAKLSVHANDGETNTTLFSIASSTASATTTLFSVLNTGALEGLKISVPDGANSVYLGHQAGESDGGSATRSVGLGYDALGNNVSGSDNTAVGYGALSSNTAGSNTAVGHEALLFNSSGANNTAIGVDALRRITTSNNNTAVGEQAGMLVSAGGNNQTSGLSVYIGSDTRASVSGALNEIVIGFEAVGAGNNSVVLGGDTISKTVLKGSVGIGTTSPFAKLAIHATSSETITRLFEIASSTASATTTHFVVDNQGQVGVGTSSPWAKFSASGTVAFANLSAAGSSEDALCLDNNNQVVVNTGAVDCTVSSERFKENIESVKTGLDLVLQLNATTFTYIDKPNDERFGLIAEEVIEIDDRLVFYEEDGTTPRGVRYTEIIPLLIKAVQELSEVVDGIVESISGFANRFVTRELCVADEAGATTCVTKAELDMLLASANISTSDVDIFGGGSGGSDVGSNTGSNTNDNPGNVEASDGGDSNTGDISGTSTPPIDDLGEVDVEQDTSASTPDGTEEPAPEPEFEEEPPVEDDTSDTNPPPTSDSIEDPTGSGDPQLVEDPDVGVEPETEEEQPTD